MASLMMIDEIVIGVYLLAIFAAALWWLYD